MKVLYIHQYFRTPETSGVTRSYWFSKKLIENGIDVTVISAKDTESHENIEGIDVYYVDNPYSQSFGKVHKVYVFIKFVLKAIWKSLKIKNVDLVYATSTPLTVGLIALVLKKVKGWRYVFEVRDLWPEFPIQIGAITNPIATKFLKAMERSIYNNSEHVVALSPGMREGVIAAGTPKEKITMIPNMSKPDLFYPRERKEDDYVKYGICKDKFNVLHAGAMGVANGLEYIIHAAIILQKEMNDDSICFVFAGGGATLPLLKKMVEDHHLHNVVFVGHHNTEGISVIMNLCDVSIVSFKNLPILFTNSPNKFFDSLSAGKPIIVNSAGWTKGIVEEHHCGYYVNPDDPNVLAKKLLEIKDKTDELKRMGNNARRLSLEVYNKDILSEKFLQVIKAHLPN